MEVREQLWDRLSPARFTWVPRGQTQIGGVYGGCLYLWSHLAGLLHFIFYLSMCNVLGDDSCVRVCAGAQGDGGSGCFEAVVTDVVTDVNHSVYMVGTELRSSARALHYLVFICLTVVL